MVQTIHSDQRHRELLRRFFEFSQQWVYQFIALLWKDLLAGYRRPLYTLAQLISPAGIIAVLGYGASLSPKVSVPGYQYEEIGTVNTTSLTSVGAGSGLPEMKGSFTGTWHGLDETVTNAHQVLEEAFSEPYFTEQQVPAFIAVTSDERKRDPAFSAVNLPAASPYLIPSLSTYLKQRETMRRHVGRLGIKSFMSINDFIWHLFRKGRIVFYPQSSLVDELANYLISTAADAEAVKAAIHPYVPNAFSTGADFGFPRLSDALAQEDTWAVINIKELSVSPQSTAEMVLDYTIMMNQTIVPTTDEVIERFPKGLGKKYADYLYSGYAVLQRAVNNFGARVARRAAFRAGTAPVIANMTLLPAVDLALSMCPDKEMFQQPVDGQRAVVSEYIANAGPIIKTVSKPSMEPAVNAPCLREAMLYCKEPFDNKDDVAMVRCLRQLSTTVSRSSVCLAALTLLDSSANGSTTPPPYSVNNTYGIGDCFNLAYTCDIHQRFVMTEFLTGLSPISGPGAGSGPNTKCFDFQGESIGECAHLNYANFFSQYASESLDICAHDVARLCPSYKDGAKCQRGLGVGCDYGPLQCLQDAIKDGKKTIEVASCASLVAAVPRCMDDLTSLCPWDTTSKIGSFPTLCLHLNRDYLSASCYQSSFRQFHLDTFFATNVSFIELGRADATCRMGHDLEAAFGYNALAAVAMPARRYVQQPFFENLGPLAGLIVAIAFSVPFSATVRRIVEDRFYYRRAYLLLIGANPSAIIGADGFSGFVHLSFAGLGVLVSLINILTESSRWMLLGILITYVMALTSFATFIASLFNNPKTANSVAPMLLFLVALPSYVTLMDMGFLSQVLPPAVAASCFNDVVAYSISTATKDYGNEIASYCGILFGQSILYAVLTFIVEYVRCMGFGFGFFYNMLQLAKRLCSSSTRLLVRPVARTAVYEKLSGRDYTGTNGWRRAVRESDLEDGDDDELGVPSATIAAVDPAASTADPNAIEFGEFNNAAGSVPLTEEYEDSAAETSSIVNRTEYSIGGIGASQQQGGQQRGGQLGPSTIASSINVSNATAPVNDLHQQRSTGSIASARFVDLVDVTYKLNRLHHTSVRTTSNVTASLYRNRVNVVVGPGGSGKSSLMAVLIGQTTPTAGKCLVDEREARFYDHRNVGVCLQRDVTWDTLSVMEHLEFLQMIKGTSIEYNADAERLALCEALQLDKHETIYADALPKGVLRRLSVAMAFVGGSKYVALDEPTTSVDAIGRRCMWRFFGENAIGRCLVVSTTNVEEAEAAEHVILMHRGEVRASGSPQFLKRHLGGGSTILSVSRGQHCNASTIIDRVRATCPRTKLINNVGQELSFRVDPADFHSVSELVAELEAAADENDVVAVSVADSRLDELFMMCVREYDASTGTEMPGSDGKFEEEAAAGGDDLATSLYQADAGDGDDDGERDPSSSTSALNGEYVSHEAAPATLSQAGSSSHSSRSGGGRRRASPSAGSSTRHVQAEAVVPVDPQWFKTLSIVGSDRERKARAESFSLVRRNIMTVMVQRVNGLLTEVVASALEFLIPIFAVIFAVGIMTIGVSDPPSLLLSPGMYSYSRVYFSHPDDAYATKLNEKLFNGNMAVVDQDGMRDLFVGRGDYRLAYTGPGITALGVSGSFAVSYDNHDRAEFMGGFAFDDTFAKTRIMDRNTHVPLRDGLEWPSSFVFHNTSSPHALPAFINVFDSLRIQKMTNLRSARILGRSDPFAAGETAKMASSKALLAMLGTILVLVPFSFLPGILTHQVVAERQRGVLGALTASKLSPVSYWLGTFFWHMIRYLFFAITAIFCITYSGARPLLGTSSSTVDTFGLLFLYGCCSISMAYLIGRCFKDALSAQSFVTLVNFVFGVVCVVSMNAMDMMGSVGAGSGSTNSVDEMMVERAKAGSGAKDRREFFRVIPAYALGEGLLKIVTSEFYESSDNANRFLGNKNSASSIFAVLGWTFPFYLAALIIFDGMLRVTCIRAIFGFYGLVRDGMLVVFNPCIRKSNVVGNNSGDPLKREPWSGDLRIHREGEDPSVTAERLKGPCADGVTLREVWRKYTGFGAEHNIYAVRGASFTVAPGDRLAIIGSNGSGKTTLVNMMAGLLAPSVGKIEIKMRPLEQTSRLHWWARSFTGFSGASVESVPDESTPYMILNILADYRGMARDAVREGHIAHLLHTLGLLTSYNKPISVLSSSKRRRVGVAMALVGFPLVIFLDEPTAGMDPVGRRMTWAALNLVPSKCVLVITTHRVDDVEMSANRVCLLQRGTVAFINDAHVAKQNAHQKGLILHVHFNLRIGSLVGGSSIAGTPIGSGSDGGGAGGRGERGSAFDGYWVKNDVQDFVLRSFPGAVLVEDRNNTDLKFHIIADDNADTFRPAGQNRTGGQNTTNTFGPFSKDNSVDPNRIGRDLLDTGRDDEVVMDSPLGGDPSPAVNARELQQELPRPNSNSSGLTIRSVFEKMHQKRVELMLQGVYGVPVGSPASPFTARNRQTQQDVIFDRNASAADENRRVRESGDDEEHRNRRHRQEIRDLLGGPAESPALPADTNVSAPHATAATAVAPNLAETGTSPASAPTSATAIRTMPFDIVITRSTIDQVLDKVLGARSESAALERMFQNTSARIPVRGSN